MIIKYLGNLKKRERNLLVHWLNLTVYVAVQIFFCLFTVPNAIGESQYKSTNIFII